MNSILRSNKITFMETKTLFSFVKTVKVSFSSPLPRLGRDPPSPPIRKNPLFLRKKPLLLLLNCFLNPKKPSFDWLFCGMKKRAVISLCREMAGWGGGGVGNLYPK